MNRLIFAFLLFCFCNLAIFAQINITKEEYGVYAGVLREINRENLDERKIKYSFVILDETFKPGFVNKYKSPKMKGLMTDFNRRNKTSIKLKRLIPINFRYEFIAKSEIDELLKIGN